MINVSGLSTGSLSIAEILLGDGSAGNPSIAFTDDATTGFYRHGAGSIGIASGGVSIGRLGLDTTFTSPTANPLIIKALSGNSNGLRVYANTATDVATIVNGYNAALMLGANNTEYVTIAAAGSVTLGASGSTQAHAVRGNGLALTRATATDGFDLYLGSNTGFLKLLGSGGGIGANIYLYGESHGSLPSETRFYNNNVLSGAIDVNSKWIIGASGSTQIHQINGGTGTAGAVSTYLKLNVNGTEYRVPLHATS